jgi:small subunit ribosomal protein S6
VINRQYELGFIIPSNVTESDTQTIIATVQEWIEKNEGSVTKVDYWGRRRLAYPINDCREGYYIFVLMDYPTQRLGELEHNLHFDERILRHLIVRLDE